VRGIALASEPLCKFDAASCGEMWRKRYPCSLLTYEGIVSDRTAQSDIVHVGGRDGRPFVFDLRARELRIGTGIISLQPQSFEILRLLVERRGDVVERVELQRALWPRGTFVDYEHSLNAAVRRLRTALGDIGDRAHYIETIPRVGYRLRAPYAAGASSYADRDRDDRRPRLAILPFLAIGCPSAFADGLTEELTMQVNRTVGGTVAVLARSSCVVFKEVRRRVADIAGDLRADYLIEGLVRMQPDKVRVTASLIETCGETHAWTDVVELAAGEMLSVQTEIAGALTRSLSRVLDRLDRRTVRHLDPVVCPTAASA
jgi:DNA-binding winged helix-turn-helix (wHTH) protein